MTVVSGRPEAPALAPFVSSIGYFQGRFGHARELALPTGTVQLLVNLDRDRLHAYPVTGGAVQRTGGAAVQGPTAGAALIDPAEQREIMWASFTFAGAYPFFPVAAAATRDQLVDLAELWGCDGAVLRERLIEAPTPAEKLRTLEAVLLARASPPRDRDPAVVAAAAALHRGAPVAAVADRLGWTARRLGRRFAEQLGLSPKRFARVRRFQRLLRAVAGAPGPVDWAGLAAECGYHDQAHLIHEFRAHAGTTPTGYAPRSADEPNHVPV